MSTLLKDRKDMLKTTAIIISDSIKVSSKNTTISRLS